MAAILKISKIRSIRLMLCQAPRYLSGWTQHNKPGPYPVTKAQRDAAAEKYGIFPEEYKPYPDDGLGYGDYPKLESGLGIEARDPFYPWDFPEHKRNFNELLHVNVNIYGEDRYSQPHPLRYSHGVYVGSFLGVMAFCSLFFFWLEDKKMFRPAAVKQYPEEGKIHYSFKTGC